MTCVTHDDRLEDFLGSTVRADFMSLEQPAIRPVPVFPRTWGMMDLSGIEFDVPVALLESPVVKVPDDPAFDDDIETDDDDLEDDDDDLEDDEDDDFDDDDDEMDDDEFDDDDDF